MIPLSEVSLVPSNDASATPAVAPAPNSVPVAPGSEVVDDSEDDLDVDVSKSLDGLTIAQLDAIEQAGGNAAAIAAALGQTGVVTAVVPDDGDDEPVVTQPAAPGATPAVPAVPSSRPGRISLNGLSDDDATKAKAAISAVKSGQYPSIVAALAGLYPDAVPASVPAPAAVVTSPVAEEVIEEVPVELDPPQALVDLRSELETIDSEFQQATAEFDTIKQNQLLLKRQDVTRKLDREEAKFEALQAQVQAFESQVDESSERALEAFPSLAVEGSPENIAVADAIILARAKGDDILRYSDWPERIANRTLQQLQRTAGAVSNPPAKTTQAATIPVPLPPGVRLPGSIVGSGNHTASLDAMTAAIELENMDSDSVTRALELADRRLGR